VTFCAGLINFLLIYIRFNKTEMYIYHTIKFPTQVRNSMVIRASINATLLEQFP